MKKIYVYYAQTSVDTAERELYPRERMDEINRCKNDSARREKYSAWKLLEHSINDAFSLDFDNLQFAKLPSGQWVCDELCFSLTHAGGAVAVALSMADVGVDIELVRELDGRLAERVLTDREYLYYQSLAEERRQNYLLETWCKKEAIFKASRGEILLPRAIDTNDHCTYIERIKIADSEYLIAVSANEPFSVELRAK